MPVNKNNSCSILCAKQQRDLYLSINPKMSKYRYDQLEPVTFTCTICGEDLDETGLCPTCSGEHYE